MLSESLDIMWSVFLIYRGGTESTEKLSKDSLIPALICSSKKGYLSQIELNLSPCSEMWELKKNVLYKSLDSNVLGILFHILSHLIMR